MTYEIYRYIFIGGMIASAIFLALSVALFFVLRIPKVISDLTGRTARKAIENIRMQNELSGDKSYQSSAVNRERGKLTDKISQSGRLVARENTPFGTGVITEKISTQKLVEESAGETTLLDSGSETTLLGDAGEATVLGNAGETSLLDGGIGETAVLDMAQAQPTEAVAQVFTLEYEVTMIHTEEEIV